MHFTTRTKITLLFTIIFAFTITILNIILFESVNREWQVRQYEYVEEVMKATYTPDEAKEKFTHLKIMNGSGEIIYTQWAYSGNTMLEKAGSLLFSDTDIYEKDWNLYFSVQEYKDWLTFDMAEDVTSIIRTRDIVVDRSLWVSIFGILAVIFIGYIFSGYILRPVRYMSEMASSFTLWEKDKFHTLDVKWHVRDEVTILARSLESLFIRVKNEAVRLEQFSDDIAHEIKNKLFSIESSLDIVLHTQHRDHGIKRAKKMISELSTVVDALLFFSRNESWKWENIDIGELMRSRLDLTDKRIEVIEESKVSKIVYPDLFITAIGNILSNAEKFTPENGKIKIILSEIGIEIRDTGVGIKWENIDKIFDRLWKSDTARTHWSGYGLGLSITRKIIESLHWWALSVESREWVGTSFFIRW